MPTTSASAPHPPLSQDPESGACKLFSQTARAIPCRTDSLLVQHRTGRVGAVVITSNLVLTFNSGGLQNEAFCVGSTNGSPGDDADATASKISWRRRGPSSIFLCMSWAPCIPPTEMSALDSKPEYDRPSSKPLHPTKTYT
jgi:hypothetical protein